MPFSRSRSPESMTRSTTAWFARKVPVWRSIASTRVVLPWSTWATMAMLRRSSRFGGAGAGGGGRRSGRRCGGHGRGECRTSVLGRRSAPSDRLLASGAMTVAAVILSATAEGALDDTLGPAAGPPARRPRLVRRGAADRRRVARPGRRRRGGAGRDRGDPRLPGAGRERSGRPDGPWRRAGQAEVARDDRCADLAGADDLGRTRDRHVADRGARDRPGHDPAARLARRAGLAGPRPDRPPRRPAGRRARPDAARRRRGARRDGPDASRRARRSRA